MGAPWVAKVPGYVHSLFYAHINHISEGQNEVRFMSCCAMYTLLTNIFHLNIADL
jgi:hypothetical protein